MLTSQHIPIHSLPTEDPKDPLQSLPMELLSDPSCGLLPGSKFSDSPPLPAVYTDVTVVPEHEKQELKQTIANLEGSIHDFTRCQSTFFGVNRSLICWTWKCRRDIAAEAEAEIVGWKQKVGIKQRNWYQRYKYAGIGSHHPPFQMNKTLTLEFF